MKKLAIVATTLILVGCQASQPTTTTPTTPSSSPSPAPTQSTAPTASSSPAPAQSAAPSTGDTSTKVSFATANAIFQQRCVTCHGGANPTAGISFADAATAKSKADRVKIRAVVQKTMPPGNQTQITDEERSTLGQWIDQGAPIE